MGECCILEPSERVETNTIEFAAPENPEVVTFRQFGPFKTEERCTKEPVVRGVEPPTFEVATYVARLDSASALSGVP